MINDSKHEVNGFDGFTQAALRVGEAAIAHSDQEPKLRRAEYHTRSLLGDLLPFARKLEILFCSLPSS